MALYALALVLPGGAAVHCNGNVVTIPLGTETIYIDDRSDEAGELDHWLYLESNRMAGLQSGGDLFVHDDSCSPAGLGCVLFQSDWCSHRDPDTLIL